MRYDVRPHPPDVAQQIDALPPAVRVDLVRALDRVAGDPWGSPSVRDDNPDAEVRVAAFGPDLAGMIVYLVLDRDRALQVELIIWLPD
ncbi:hypothetical protein [Actinomycetospora flava]|uniref:ParE-like toxin of type II ParDE toxin-antitoxin system n=1 Tax=Actinomycetospora flava TaxID=3129232 RepID=A0ABU8LZU5_9PSEU